jgi:hypothetical protein
MMISRSYMYFLAVTLSTGLPCLGAEQAESKTNQVVSVIRSFYDLPEDATVIKAFPRSTGSIVRHFANEGITVEPLPGNASGHGYGFVGPVSHSLHGTTDAPFGRSLFALQHRPGILLRFRKPQSVVAMTIAAPTTRMDVGIDLLFCDERGKQLATVNASTEHVEGLGFDNRGCVFRGLRTQRPVISAVHIVPTHIPDGVKIVLAQIDYVSFADSAEDPELRQRIMEGVEGLGAPEYELREHATIRLSSLEPCALSILNAIDAGDDPEVTMRLRRVIAAVEKKRVNVTPNGQSE